MKKQVAKLLLVTMLVGHLPMQTYGQVANPKNQKGIIEGKLDVKINLKYPIKPDKANTSNLFLKISEKGKSGSGVNVEQEIEVTEETSTLDIRLPQKLPTGTYNLLLAGDGYTDLTGDITINKHDVHVEVAEGAFLAGDVNEDGRVDNKDIDLLENQVGVGAYNSIYDLNRDGKIDITDLTYTYLNEKVEQEKLIKVSNTTLIPQAAMDTEKLEELWQDANITIKEGKIEDLFSEEDKVVTLESPEVITEEKPLAIPVVFEEIIPMSQVSISLGQMNKPTALTLEVEDEKGNIEHYPYAAEIPNARFRSVFYNASDVITIDLGRKVPVKKVTIKVTKVEDENSKLADIAKVEFLEDILENAEAPDRGIIKNLAVKAGDQELTVTWDQATNVTGYLVEYGDKSGNYAESVKVNNNKVVIGNFKGKKLVNYKPYYIRVTATNGDWKGDPSNEIEGIPIPKSVPLPPDNPNARPGNEKIYFSWSAPESAVGYNVYYKAVSDTEYTKVSDIKETSYAINGLTNGRAYEMYVTAYNELGEGRPSTSVVCIPEKEDIKIPEVPTYNLINTPNGKTEGIKTDHIIDVKLVDKNNISSEYPKDFNIEDVVDGDYYTHWTAATYQRSRGITITFDKPYEMNYVAYISRLDGKYKESPYRYNITVWESDDAAPRQIVKNEIISGYSKNGLAILPFEKSMVKKITVEVRQWNGSPTNISASELKFYEYYGIDDEIKSLFADDTFTTLSGDTTQEKIDNIRQLINGMDGRYYVDSDVLLEELDMAEALLKGSDEKLGTIVDVYSGRSTYEDNKRGFAMQLNTDQPLGIVAKAEYNTVDEINNVGPRRMVVYVDAPAEVVDLPSLVFTQYFAEPGNFRRSVPLKRGRNIISIPNIGSYKMTKGGSVYLSETNSEDIRVHIKGTKDRNNRSSITIIPKLTVLDINKDSKQAIQETLKIYIEELTTYVSRLGNINGQEDYRNSTEIETDKILLSLPATEVLKGIQAGGSSVEEQVEALWQTLNAWEETMTLHYTMMGLSEDATQTYNRFPTSRMNTRYMRMFGKAFMYATSGHIGIGYGSVPGTMQGKPALNGNPSRYFGWGINHEIGHVLNYNQYTFAEVTNNIFSLFAQEANNEEIRISSKEATRKVYQKVAVPTVGRAADVFVNLAMYWQLHQAYDDNKVMEKDDFYPRLHRAYREENVPSGDEGFAIIASQIANKNLTEFFTHWGMELNESTKAKLSTLPTEDKKIYYMNDDAFTYRVKGGTGIERTTLTVGTEIISPEKDTNTSQRVKVSVHVPEEHKKHILGYEILRNGKVIGFTTEAVYEDIIGAANNRTFTYSVKAYDKLLNEIKIGEGDQKEAFAPEIKISHDGVVSKAGWSVKYTTSGSILIDMQKVNSIAGIKFKDLPSGSFDYTIKVKPFEATTSSAIKVDLDGVTTGPSIGVSDWVIAKSSNTADLSEVEYFNKPGTNASDTRIWTYDTRYIEIEGITGLTLDQIEIVSYPGDNVEIRPGAIGKLGQDYRYGDDEDQVIKAGTVIIVGDYRGDAVYNVIKPKGIFEVGSHGNYETTEKIINGYSLMLAEIPEDKAVSTISDGIWIYVPDEVPFEGALGDSGQITDSMTDEQKELLEDTKAVLERIKVELYRVDNPETLENERLVSDTIWIEVPVESEMPTINLVSSR